MKKRKMFKVSSILGIVFFIGACAASGPLYIDSPLPKGNDALVHIYRLGNTPPLGRDAYFYVNDINIVDLSRNGYTWFHIPAGQYTLKQKWPLDIAFGLHDIVIPVHWLPEQKIYYRFESAYGLNMGMREHKWRLREVPEVQALDEIRNCKLQPPVGLEKFREKKK